MTTLMIIMLVYFVLGALIVGRGVYLRWARGEDLMLDDLAPLLMCWLMWPLVMGWAVVDMVDEKLLERKGVLLHGSKSAKVERALRK